MENNSVKPSEKWSALAHKLCQQLKDYQVQNKKILIAFSGGADSVALLLLMLELKKYLNLEIILAHSHHGDHENRVYRDEAIDYSQKISDELNLKLFTIKNESDQLKSEEALRDFRYEFLNQIKNQEKCDLIATAHHAEDVLESRVMSLIRGVGLEKIKSIQVLGGVYFRPLVSQNKSDLLDYLKQKNHTWLEDPSNMNNDYFRNWIRNDWLKSLEAKRPGSLKSLARSLEQLSENKVDFDEYFINQNRDQGLDAQQFYTLSALDRKALLTSYIRGLGYEKLSRGLVDEIIKYLDKNQKSLTLTIGGIKIQANAQQISLCIVSENAS